MVTPKISVILPTHNRSELLPRTVYSLLNQTYQDFEIIIIDDASQDNTPEIIQEMVKADPRIRSIRSDKNIGPGAARNLGVAQARGEYIAIMDDDDIAIPERLETEVNVLENDPDVSLVFSSVAWMDDNLELFATFPGIVSRGEFPINPHNVFKLLYLESNKIPNATIMFSRTLLELFKYPDTPWVGEDWYLFMQLAASNVIMRAIELPLVHVSRGLNHKNLMSFSSNRTFQAQHQVLEKIKAWLIEQGNHNFDSLHKLALSNQLIRESRHFIGFRGLGMLFKAFFIAPRNPKVSEQLHWYWKQVLKKMHFGNYS